MAEENEAVMAEVMNLLEAEPVAALPGAALPAARPDIPALHFLSFSRKALSLVVRLKDTEALQNELKTTTSSQKNCPIFLATLRRDAAVCWQLPMRFWSLQNTSISNRATHRLLG